MFSKGNLNRRRAISAARAAARDDGGCLSGPRRKVHGRSRVHESCQNCFSNPLKRNEKAPVISRG